MPDMPALLTDLQDDDLVVVFRVPKDYPRRKSSRIEWGTIRKAILAQQPTVQGMQGNPGKDGTPGRDGTNGKDGLPGRDGTNGTNGKDGIQGLPGRDGTNGTNGKDGAQGPHKDRLAHPSASNAILAQSSARTVSPRSPSRPRSPRHRLAASSRPGTARRWSQDR